MPDLGQLPLSLRTRSRWMRVAGVPALIVHPEVSDLSQRARVPVFVWMHGRTAQKELDPGRFLRLVRAGIGVCSLDLPGHGERMEADEPPEGARTLEVVEQMERELDAVVDAMIEAGPFDRDAMAIGGFSAGGMAALVRLCRPHTFRCAVIEATTGAWNHQRGRAMFDADRVARLDPIEHLDQWRPIPLLVLHATLDEWVPIDGQRAFVQALIDRGTPKSSIEFHAFDQTGAPAEHIGFGRYASQAKDMATEFLVRHLLTHAAR